MLSAGVEQIAESLRQYGEAPAAAWVLECSEDDLIKVCSVANWLLHHGAGPRAGGSMMIAKACALAAIYVREGAPRDLALSRRGKPSGTPISPSGGPGPEVQPAQSAWNRFWSGRKASRPGDREPGHNALTTRLLCHHDDSRLAAYCRPAR